MRLLIGVLLALWLTTPASAEWSRLEWAFVPETWSHKAAKEELNAALLPLVELRVSKELEDIGLWMSGLGFPQGVMSRTGSGDKGGLTYGFFGKNRALNDVYDGHIGAYRCDDAEIELPYHMFPKQLSGGEAVENFLDPYDSKLLSSSLAHELYHAVQKNRPSAHCSNDKNPPFAWILHGMPEAAGIQWAYMLGGGNSKLFIYHIGHFDRPLHKPEDASDRGYFFFRLGEDIKSRDSIEYFNELEESGNYTTQGNGLDWLGGYLANRTPPLPLYQYFPQFIAGDAWQAAFYSQVDNAGGQQKYQPTDVESEDHYDGKVLKVAAAPYKAYVDFTKAGLVARPYFLTYPLVLFEQEIVDRKGNPHPDETDLTLVVDKVVAPKDAATGKNTPYRRILIADPYDATGYQMFNRVVNVAFSPADKPDQTKDDLEFRVAQRVRPLILEPSRRCLEPQVSFDLVPVDERSGIASSDLKWMQDVELMRWKVSGLTVDDPNMPSFTPTVPEGGEITISVEVKQGENWRAQEIIRRKVGECQVQMDLPESAGTATYDYKGDYMEVATTEGVKAYLGINRAAVHDPQDGGWVPIPPAAQVQVSAMFNQQFSLAAEPGLPPWVRSADPGHTSRMLWLMGDWWDFDELALLILSEDPPTFPNVSLRFACPEATEQCRMIEMVAEGVTSLIHHDEYKRLVAVDTPGPSLQLRYGGFDIGRPPGWPDQVARPKPERGPASNASAPPNAAAGSELGKVRPQTRPSSFGGTGSDGPGGTCDCSCGALKSGSVTQSCALHCAPKWAQCTK